MGNFFDIEYEQEYLIDFLEDITEKIIDIEQIVHKLNNCPSTDASLVTLIGTINTLKSNANETQIIPLASSLDSLENILSLFAKQGFQLPGNFSAFILAIFEIAREMSEQAAEIQKVDFDLFSKIQNSLQPLSQCDANNLAETISLSVALLSSEEDSEDETSDSSIDLFGDENSSSTAEDIELFDNDDSKLIEDVELFDTPALHNKPIDNTSNINQNNIYITSEGPQFFTPIQNKRSIEDLQAFRLLADEAASDNHLKITTILNLARFMNAAANNLVDASQLEAAVYLTEVRPICPRRCAQQLAKMTVVPTAPGWELASSIVVFQDLNNPNLKDTDKSLGTQIFNGAQILGLCFTFYDIIKDNRAPEIILQAKKDIVQMRDRFSPFWIKTFLKLVDRVIKHLELYNNQDAVDISSKKILCIDDDEITLMVFEHMLTKAGHTPVTVDNYDDALKMIEISPPDLILLDLNMPGKGGYWMLEEQKNNKSLQNIPIAIISGSKDDYGIHEDEVVGIYEKPISKNTMLNIVNKAFS